jgi:type III pantothenate kinase
MLIVINIGNTRTICASVIEGEVREKFHFYTHSELTQLKKFLGKLFKSYAVKGIVLSSVVPSATKNVTEFIANNCSIEPIIVKYSYLKDIFKLELENPKSLGSDRIANIIGATKEYGNGLIIVDMGTATTFEVINHNGTYIGGVIAPGIWTQVNALSSSTALLPEIELARPNKIIATNTVDAMKVGVYYGYIDMIEGIIERIKASYADPLRVIVTGGALSIVLDEVTKIDYKDPELLIKGLIEIYRLIGKKI